MLTAILTTALALHGQERGRLADPNLLARLSFDNSSALQAQGTQHVCIAVDADGSYRMVRRLANPGPLQRLEGTMSSEQIQQLKTLLGSTDLRSLPPNHGGLIRQSAESFLAEIPVLDKQASAATLHIEWLNADGKTPFPPPVSKIVDWLNRFEPRNAKPAANLEFQDACPSVGLHLLQPSVASNVP